MRIRLSVILIIAFVFFETNLFAQDEMQLSLSQVVDILALDAPDARIERLNFENEILQFQNYRKGFLPSLSLDMSPFDFNRSIVKLQRAEDGRYYYVEEYSGRSNMSLHLRQKLLLTGGTLSVNSSLNYLNELSQSRHSFSSTPFAVSYSQKLFGSRKTMLMDRTIEYKKNEESIRNYCVTVSGIQSQALNLFMDVFLSLLEMQIASSNKSATDSLLYMAKIKYENNRITETDFKQLELQATNNEFMKENALKSYEDALRGLVIFLDLDKGLHEIKVEVPEFSLPLQIDIETVRYYVEKNNPIALSNNIKWLQAEKNLFSSELQQKFNADINLSYGMNQYAEKFSDVYSNPSRQQSVSIGFSIPVSLWGMNRNNARIARNNYNNTKISIEKELNEFEKKMYDVVNNYNHNVNLWVIAERSYNLAQEHYKLVVQQFAMGKSSAYELISSQQEQSSSMQNFYNAVKNVWESYFKLREMTLYDFKDKMELTDVLLKTDTYDEKKR